MEGLAQRLFVWVVIAAVVLLASAVALGFGWSWQPVALMALVLASVLVVLHLTLSMRRDVKMLKTQALELSGYENEIGRRVDHLASLVEKSGGAATDEIAKRVRAVNHQYAAMVQRMDALEQDVAELAITRSVDAKAAAPLKARKPLEPQTVPVSVPVQRKSSEAKVEGKPEATVVPLQKPAARPAARPAAKVAAKAAEPVKPAAKAEPSEAQAWRAAVASDRLTFHLVPVLALPERKPVFYEAVMRLQNIDGSWTEPDELMREAEKHQLSALIERKTLYTAARMLRSVRRMGKEMRLIAPIAAPSLVDDRGFSELRTFLEAAPDLREALVLEVPQERFRTLPGQARQRIGLIADAGFGLSLGHLADQKIDAPTLHQLGFRIVRGSASVLAGPRAAGTGTSLAVTLASHQIDLVATGVAEETTLLSLIDHDVTHAQGPILSAPRLVKSDLLQAPARVPEASPQAAAG